MRIARLPDDVWGRILQHLDTRDLTQNCALVCRSWTDLVKELTAQIFAYHMPETLKRYRVLFHFLL